MTVRGHVENGRIVLDQETVLPEGTRVEITFVGGESRLGDEAGLPTLYERFKSIIGQAKGLPSDFAASHSRVRTQVGDDPAR